MHRAQPTLRPCSPHFSRWRDGPALEVGGGMPRGIRGRAALAAGARVGRRGEHRQREAHPEDDPDEDENRPRVEVDGEPEHDQRDHDPVEHIPDRGVAGHRRPIEREGGYKSSFEGCPNGSASAALSAASRIARRFSATRSGKIPEPETRMSAPASPTIGAVSTLIPPSTWSCTGSPSRSMYARASRIFGTTSWRKA